jgi:hypothetical protein
MEWLKARVKEVSSLHGGALIAMGLIILFASPIAKMAAWASIAWGFVGYLEERLNYVKF